MSFRLVPKSVTLNDLERRNGVILHYFSEIGSFLGALRKSSRSLSHLLMSSCYVCFCKNEQKLSKAAELCLYRAPYKLMTIICDAISYSTC